MIRPFKKTLYNCRQATLLSIKREGGRISLLERVTLAYHLTSCEPCRRFIQQWNLLGKKRDLSFHQPPFALRPEARQRIQRQLDSLTA